MTCRIRNKILCSRQNPCLYCIIWEDRDWACQDIRVDKIRRDWEMGLKQIQQTPAPAHVQPIARRRGAISTSAFVSGSSVAPQLEASRTSTQSQLVVELPLSISRQSLDKALSMTQLRRFRPPQRPVLTTGSNLPLSLNTLKLFEAGESLLCPSQTSRNPGGDLY